MCGRVLREGGVGEQERRKLGILQLERLKKKKKKRSTKVKGESLTAGLQRTKNCAFTFLVLLMLFITRKNFIDKKNRTRVT